MENSSNEKCVITKTTTTTKEQIVDNASKMTTNGRVDLNYVQNKLENVKKMLVKDVEKRMAIAIDDIMQDIAQHELQKTEFQEFAKPTVQREYRTSNTWNNRSELNHMPTTKHINNNTNLSNNAENNSNYKNQRSSKELHKGLKQLPEKVFVKRESYLTVLLEIPHMKSIYHIFYIILLVFLLNSICYDYFVDGKVNFGLGTFKTGFDKLHLVLLILFVKNIFVISLYFGLKLWSIVRNKLIAQETLQSLWSNGCLAVYIASQIIFAYIASALCIKLQLPFVSACVLLLESTRLLMKMHAFVRVNAARQISEKLKIDSDEKSSLNSTNIRPPMPPLSSYIYFLFAPTLIYRDQYPRTTLIRWKFAFNRLLEVVAVAFLYSYIHERYIRVHFANYGLEPLNESLILVKLFGMIMPSIIIFLCGFYLILHSWLNFTSELLRFGDRMFYKDWWTSGNYDAYFRNWNVVVHDWLYEYIYKDCYNYIFKGSKVAGSIMVFMVSALVHEHILAFALRIFFPVMFVFFGIVGVSCVYLTRKLPKSLGNIFLWGSLIFGNSLMISLYCMEYYAQQNCPKTNINWFDYFIPAIWKCYNR